MKFPSILKFNKFLYYLSGINKLEIKTESKIINQYSFWLINDERLCFTSYYKLINTTSYYCMGIEVYEKHLLFNYPNATEKVIKILLS